MKPLLLSFLAGAVLFTSCLKEPQEPELIVDPPDPIEVRLDSTMEGTIYNVTIGDNAEQVYADLQQYAKDEKQIPYLAITGQFNTEVADLENRIPLYNSLIFDKKPSAAEGGQIYFEDGIIKSIYNRDGKKRQSWPSASSDALKVGDGIGSVYGKLVKLQRKPSYAGFFAYIGMFDKNIKTEYDLVQQKSTLWQLSVSEDDKNFIRIDLIFEDGVLIKVRSRHERYL